MATIVPPVLLVFSVVVAAISARLAFRNIENARDIARQRATLDLIEKAESTPHYRELAAAFGEAERNNKLGLLNDPQNEPDRELRRRVLDYLNHYELVALGIKHRILDEAIYREWIQSHVVREWNAAAEFVQNERWRLNEERTDFEYKSRLFCQLQAVVCRWSSEATWLDERVGPKPTLPADTGAPGDAPLPDVSLPQRST